VAWQVVREETAAVASVLNAVCEKMVSPVEARPGGQHHTTLYRWGLRGSGKGPASLSTTPHPPPGPEGPRGSGKGLRPEGWLLWWGVYGGRWA
jgi:hypothetical protein